MSQNRSPASANDRLAVLVVDDEPELLKTMREVLAAEMDIDTATSAAEAEMLMAVRSYAVVICDHLMPGESGLDFLVRMRELHPQTKRILITGYLNPELLSRSIAVGGLSDCLIKPMSNAEVVNAVRAAVL